MSRPLLAYWYARLPNFGDLLTPFYIKRLTHRAPINLMGVDRGHKLRRYNLAKRSHRHYLLQKYRVSRAEEFSCVGSILGRGDWNDARATVWGSGFLMPPSTRPTAPHELRCVRGELSLSFYDKATRTQARALGDPGVLVADFFDDKVQPRVDVGLIAHYSEKNQPFLVEARRAGIRVIDIQQSVVSFVGELRECSVVLSSAMHALIAADSFGIPNRWVGFGTRLMDERFKFHDYFSVAGGHQRAPDLVTNLRDMRAAARRARTREIKRVKSELWASNPFTGQHG